MKILDVGHKFELMSLGGKHRQVLQFVKRKGLKYPGNTSGYPGTTTQDVIHCLLNRMRYVQNQIPCVENEMVITKLQECLFLLESRASKRHGKQLEVEKLSDLEFSRLCVVCGHTQCKHQKGIINPPTQQ